MAGGEMGKLGKYRLCSLWEIIMLLLMLWIFTSLERDYISYVLSPQDGKVMNFEVTQIKRERTTLNRTSNYYTYVRSISDNKEITGKIVTAIGDWGKSEMTLYVKKDGSVCRREWILPDCALFYIWIGLFVVYSMFWMKICADYKRYRKLQRKVWDDR